MKGRERKKAKRNKMRIFVADFKLAKTKRWRRREVHCSEMRKDGSVDKIGREGRRRVGKEGGRLKEEEEEGRKKSEIKKKKD
jgi:hypothetical protein